MRLAFTALLLVVASPAVAAPEARCMVHVHAGAQPFIQSGDIGPMEPVKRVGPHLDESPIDDEVDHLDTLTPDGPWIWRRHSYIFRLSDVTIYGDCTHMRVNDLG